MLHEFWYIHLCTATSKLAEGIEGIDQERNAGNKHGIFFPWL